MHRKAEAGVVVLEGRRVRHCLIRTLQLCPHKGESCSYICLRKYAYVPIYTCLCIADTVYIMKCS